MPDETKKRKKIVEPAPAELGYCTVCDGQIHKPACPSGVCPVCERRGRGKIVPLFGKRREGPP